MIASLRRISLIAACGVLVLGCVGGRSGRLASDSKADLSRNTEALERLEYGMTADTAGSVMGRARMVPPWANAWDLGPQLVANPLDTLEFESPAGESYRVDRYAIELYGDPNCPFVRGEATLAPLIYLDGRLVGWSWAYLESALQRPLQADEREFRFGGFCGGPTETSAQPTDSAAPRSDTGASSASNPDPRQ